MLLGSKDSADVGGIELESIGMSKYIPQFFVVTGRGVKAGKIEDKTV